jgi:tetratricopeptide (TPR) repeat protein
MGAVAVDLMLREAAEHYNTGRPEAAGVLCADILNLHPDHIPALHLAAVIACSGGRMAEGVDLLGKVFLLDRNHVPALVTLADALAVKGEREGAVAALQRAVELRPLDIGLHAKLGAALVDSARFVDAASIYRSVLELDPDQVQMHFNLAICLAAAGHLLEAEEGYRAVVARDALHHGAWFELGNLLVSQHRFDEAIAPYRQAIAANPADAGVHQAIGAALHRCGRLDEAIFHYRKLVELAPNDRPALRTLGLVLHEAGRIQEAVTAYRQFTTLYRTDVEIYDHLCTCLYELEQLDEAAAVCERVLTLNPDYTTAHINRGVIFGRKNDIEAAVAAYRRAIAADPSDARGYANLAVALHEQGEIDAALEVGYRAVALAPEHPLVRANLAAVLLNKGEVDEALAVSRRAVALAPEDPVVRFNHSLLLLLCGDFHNGLADYRWRHRCSFERMQRCSGPEWQGESFIGRTLLLFSEQGIGDVLQFIRYLPQVAAKGGAIVLRVQATLVLLLRSLEGITVIAHDAPLPPLDLQLPLMDLPHVFGTTVDCIPADIPYLHPDPKQVETWRGDFHDVAALKVGIVWAGNPTHKSDRFRSLAAGAVLPHLVMPGVQLYSLQKEPRPADVPVLAGLGSDVIDLAPRLGDFADTAAAVAALDLVISVDTSVVHLAGAMGRPTWVLLPYAQDWRWLRDREDTPWYPGMRLFRQRAPQAWAEVIARVSAELARVAGGERGLLQPARLNGATSIPASFSALRTPRAISTAPGVSP